MNKLRNLAAALTIATTIGASTAPLNADYCRGDTRGCGYEDCCTAPCISPTVALGAVAVVAVVAVIIHSNDHSHHHSHYHSN